MNCIAGWITYLSRCTATDQQFRNNVGCHTGFKWAGLSQHSYCLGHDQYSCSQIWVKCSQTQLLVFILLRGVLHSLSQSSHVSVDIRSELTHEGFGTHVPSLYLQAVAYPGGVSGVQTPPKFRKPSKKIVPNSTRL